MHSLIERMLELYLKLIERTVGFLDIGFFDIRIFLF